MGIPPYAKAYRSVLGETHIASTAEPEDMGQLVLPGMEREVLQHAVPYHAMNREQFAAQPEVWWHGRYSEDPPESHSAATGQNLIGVHVGTQEAARERLRKVGPYDANRAAENMPEIPGMGSREEPPSHQPGRLFPMVNTGRMRNRPSQPYEDEGETWERRTEDRYTGEVKQSGWYYRNSVEDDGSISVGYADRHEPNEMLPKLATHGDLIRHQLQFAPGSVHPAIRHLYEHGAEHTGEAIFKAGTNEAPMTEEELRQGAGAQLFALHRAQYERRTGMRMLFAQINEGSRHRQDRVIVQEGGGAFTHPTYKDETHYMTHEGWEEWKQRFKEDPPTLKAAGPSKPAF
jgi:hypothetical protein